MPQQMQGNLNNQDFQQLSFGATITTEYKIRSEAKTSIELFGV